MYSYLYGKVISINKKSITFDCNNVGYVIYVNNTDSFKLNTMLYLYVYRQYKLTSKNSFVDDIYGFKTYLDKELFLSLMRCQGIGAKTSLLICSNDNNLLKQLIVTKNYDELAKCKGINTKSAKIIIDTLYEFYKNKIDNSSMNNMISELFSALNALGYKENDIQYAISKMSLINTSNKEELSSLIADAIKIIINKDTNAIESN